MCVLKMARKKDTTLHSRFESKYPPNPVLFVERSLPSFTFNPSHCFEHGEIVQFTSRTQNPATTHGNENCNGSFGSVLQLFRSRKLYPAELQV